MSGRNPYQAPERAEGEEDAGARTSDDTPGAYALGVALMQGAAAVVLAFATVVMFATGADSGDREALVLGVVFGVGLLGLVVLVAGSLVAWRGGRGSARRSWLLTLVGWMILGVWPVVLLAVSVWISAP